MNLDIFLSKYCSEQTKARLSLLHNKNYTTYQFLSKMERYKDDNVEMFLYPDLIHVTKIKCNDLSLIDVVKMITTKYVEYVAYSPVIRVAANIPSCMYLQVYNGNRLYYPETGNYLDLRYVME